MSLRIDCRVWALALLAACGSKKTAHEDAGGSAVPRDAAAVVKHADASVPPDAAVARVEHPVFDLVDNRHAAHRAIESDFVLDGADIGLARYTRFGVPVARWHLGQTVDGERAAIADRLASLEVPLTAEQAAAHELTMRVHGSDRQSVNLRVNGRGGKHSSVPLVAGWQTVAIPIEASRLQPGENQLVFETSGGKAPIAIAWARLGAGDDDPRASAVFDPKAHAIALATGASLAWYVTIPDAATLVADVTPAACRVDVQATTTDASAALGSLPRVELTPEAGKVVRLALTARGCPRATITNPRIVLPGAAPALLAKAPPPRYIILWVMDALRADKIPIFTPGARALTPNFDELAKTSAVFRQYYVQGNESQVSHSSMWTSLYPAVHGVRDAGIGGTWKLSAKLDVIAARLSEAGLYTEAVTGNGFVNEDSGYARGFREYRNMMRETGVPNGIIYGQQIVDAALKRLDAHRKDPTYLFLGTIDTHGPWIARKPWINIYSPGKYTGPFQEYGTSKELGITSQSMGCAIIPPPVDIERLRAIYDSAVSYHDQMVGRMVAQLKAWGIWDQTMLILTADHGDELFEDNRCGHGGSLRDTLIRVPLLIHDPARFPGGTIVDEGAESVDLMPSMLQALGAPPVPAAQGEALEPIAEGIGRGWARPSYASMYEYAHAMRIGRWKTRVANTGIPTVEDMVGDAGEKHDLAAERPVERRMLTDNLGMFLQLRRVWKKASWGVTTSVTPEGAAALDEATTP